MASLPKIRQDLKAALLAERDSARRKEIGRALAAIERAESKQLDTSAQKC
jgi:hypothetical protein